MPPSSRPLLLTGGGVAEGAVNACVCVCVWVLLTVNGRVCVFVCLYDAFFQMDDYDSNETEEFVRNRTRKHIYTLRMLVMIFVFLLLA